MKCPKCGAEVGAEDQFCGECGAVLRAERTGEMVKAAPSSNENIKGMLCYLLGWLTGLIFLLVEKENKFVRFHAIQSLVTFLFFSVILWLFEPTVYYDPYIEYTSSDSSIYGIVFLLMFILWLLLMYKAYKGEKFKLPIVGDFAEKRS